MIDGRKTPIEEIRQIQFIDGDSRDLMDDQVLTSAMPPNEQSSLELHYESAQSKITAILPILLVFLVILISLSFILHKSE